MSLLLSPCEGSSATGRAEMETEDPLCITDFNLLTCLYPKPTTGPLLLHHCNNKIPTDTQGLQALLAIIYQTQRVKKLSFTKTESNH